MSSSAPSGSVVAKEVIDQKSALTQLLTPLEEAAEFHFKSLDTAAAELAASVVKLEAWDANLDK